MCVVGEEMGVCGSMGVSEDVDLRVGGNGERLCVGVGGMGNVSV